MIVETCFYYLLSWGFDK